MSFLLSFVHATGSVSFEVKGYVGKTDVFKMVEDVGAVGNDGGEVFDGDFNACNGVVKADANSW